MSSLLRQSKYASKMLRIFAYLIIVVILLIFISMWPHRNDGREHHSLSMNAITRFEIHVHFVDVHHAKIHGIVLSAEIVKCILFRIVFCASLNSTLSSTNLVNRSD